MGENISDENLFHFTKSFENLISILANGFIPNYCLENWLSLDSHLDHIGIPMVCFTDIPLKYIGAHQKRYGPYGISISKDWGMLNGITPIAYVHKKSSNYKALQKISELYRENYNSIKSKDFIKIENDLMNGPVKIYDHFGVCSILENAFYELLCLFKPYIGDDVMEKDVCFYDEREWRYYPSGVIPPSLRESYYYRNNEGKLVLDENEKESYSRNLKENYTLHFPLDAVNIVYVENDEEKQTLKKKFGDLFQIEVN